VYTFTNVQSLNLYTIIECQASKYVASIKYTVTSINVQSLKLNSYHYS